MRVSTILGSLFVAGALSAPVAQDVVYDVVYQTVTVTAKRPNHHQGYTYTYSFGQSAASSTQISTPAPTSTQISTPAPTSTPPAPTSTVEPSSTPEPETSSTPQPTPTPQPIQQPTSQSDGSPKSAGVSLLSIVNKWRGKYALSSLAWSDTLTNNALKTGTDDDGVNQKHELNPGSMAQVITPGMQTAYGDIVVSPFELSYVAWLCEVSSDPQLKSDNTDYCKLVADHLFMSYDSTGHHDILNSPSYQNIGCAFAANPSAGTDTPYQGLWICDLN